MKIRMTIVGALATLIIGQVLADSAVAVAPQAGALPFAELPPMPQERSKGKHVNRVIDLWSKGQPVYYTGAGDGGYEDGKRLAATKADYINYNLEHAALDFTKLREFMRGLKEAGPTRTGHPTPPVIATLPIQGTADAVRANAWMIQQALAAGIHGILLCNAESPEAVNAMIEASRYPFAPEATGLSQGFRGNGSQGYASEIWGLTSSEYMRVADPWPLNPQGEFIFGVKIENPRSLVNVDSILRVPGLAFAEWGPGDNGFYLVGRPEGNNSERANHPVMREVRARVLAAAKRNNIKFLNSCNEQNVVEQIKDGVMICTGGDGPGADKGRAYTKRTDPT